MIAGMLCTMRKIATAASTARMIEPATIVLVENTRSPRRWRALIAPVVPLVIPGFLRGSKLGLGCIVRNPGRICVERYLIVAIAAATSAASCVEIGAEPAVFAALAWPAALAT